MFVRWIVRGHKNSEIADVEFHDAYLVESFRDENGNPRQRTVSYLGNIRQMDGTFPTIERELFLLRAENILESLSELSPEDRRHVMGLLQQKVPPLDAREVMIGFKNTLRWYCRWWQDNGEMPSESELIEQISIAQRTTENIIDDQG